MSGNAGQVNRPPDVAVVAELTLLLRANGDPHERTAGGLVVFCHAGGWGCLSRACGGVGGSGGTGSSFPSAKRRSAGATSSAAALAKSNSGSGTRRRRRGDRRKDVSRRLGSGRVVVVVVVVAKVARSWEKEILGLISSADASSSIGPGELSVESAM
jgi:hypothetical protein